MKSLFSKMDVAKKFILTFSTIIGATVGCMLILFFLLSGADNEIDKLMNKPYVSMNAQLEFTKDVSSLDLAVHHYINETNKSTADASLKDIDELNKKIEASLKTLSETASDSAKIQNISAAYADSLKVVDKIKKLVAAEEKEEALTVYTTDFLSKLESIDALSGEVGTSALAQISDQVALYKSKSIRAIIIFCILTSIALAITALIFVVFRASVVDPLKKIVYSCTDLRNGKTIRALNINSKDEFGELANSFEAMNDNIAFIIEDMCKLLSKAAAKDLNAQSEDASKYIGKYKELIDSVYTIFNDMSKDMRLTNDIAEQVSSGSNQISSVSQSLSQGTTEQASAIEQLSATVTNIADLSRKNAEQASKASTLSIEAVQGLDESDNYMAQMLEAMNEITATSKEIGKIVKAIDDIAFQTNILSLNAAVEAARAGASGKGFAVVADEVRNLAQRSAEAAKNTTALIESTVIAIDNGRKIADATAKSLHTVEEKSDFVSNAMIAIAEASQHQAIATEQVLQGIDQVSSVVQTNSATAEESAAASQELASQAKILSEMTSQYKLFGDVKA